MSPFVRFTRRFSVEVNLMVVVDKENCKGCGRCVTACPKKCLALGEELNAMGIKAVQYKGEGCISCGICFYNCPEPYAIKVEK